MERITAIGEILFDVYPETKNLGGAPLNFLYHVHKLTNRGNIISRVGFDVLGNKVLNFLKRKRIETKYIQVDHLHPTGVTTVNLDENKVPSFNIDEERAYDYIEMNDEIAQLINEKTDCLYFGSLAQRSETSKSTIHNLFGKKTKYFCDLNIRQNFYSEGIITKSLTTANALKLNIDELKLINDLLFKEKFSIDTCSKRVMENFDIELIAITKGAEGSTLYNNKEKDDCRTISSAVVDTLGAGDTFNAAVINGCLAGQATAEILEHACRLAGRKCMQDGFAGLVSS